MSRIALSATLIFAACCTAAGVASPIAAADGGADEVVSDLQAQGYLVQINWVNGQDTKPLALCSVSNVNNPGDLPPGKATVYVDVMCPNHDY